jgi:DeoR/GlpR family transcriptional regulator of sugar metabolism
MLKEERQKIILEKITKTSRVISSELCRDLEVSEDTIRRDLKELSDKGLIKKVHGGAILNESSYIPMKYDDRRSFASKEKMIIAQKAVNLIKEDMVILIDGGTTNIEIVKNLPKGIKLTVITNCLPVALELVHNKFIDTIFVGGYILPGVPITVGLDALNFLDEINVDILFLGTRSIDLEKGLSDIDREEVLVKRKMVERSNVVVSIAISDKLNSVQSFKITSLENIDILITELDVDDPILTKFKDVNGLELI